jgi:putative heme-binding domain-containing protein
MLNASLGDPRVDAVALLDAMKSREIPIANKATLVARAKKEISLEPAAIQILLRNPQSSAGFSRWLFAIAQSKSRDTILRTKASSLLLPLNDIPFRDGFSLVDQLLSCDLPQKDSQRLLRGFGKVEVPEREISSLLQRAKGSDENKAVLGWIVLIGLLERDDTSPSDIDRIRAALDDVSDGVALRALLKAATVKDVPEVESLLAKAAVSDLEETQKLEASLAGQMRRNMLTGQAGEKETREKSELAALAKKIARVEADPEIGWHVFNREGCASCHNIQGEGPVSGPDIVSTATARTVQQFVNEVLSVTSGYGSHGFELKDGARIFGIVEDRTEEVLSLRDTGGNRVSLPRDQVHLEWKSDEALMHSHYGQTISATELAAIRAYLLKLGGGK